MLKVDDFFLRTEDLGFKLLEFRRNITLGIDQGLFTDVIGRYCRGIGMRYLDIVAKHFVVTDLKRLDAGTLFFPRFHVLNPLPTVTRQTAQFIQFQIVAVADEAAFADRKRRRICDGGPDQIGAVGMGLHVESGVKQ